MRRTDIFLVSGTAFVGLLFGMFLYFTNFDLFDSGGSNTVASQDAYDSLSVVGEVYGGCALTEACPSFQLLADGSYRYRYTPGFGQDQILREGNLPRALMREIVAGAAIKRLEVQAKTIEPALCNSYTDGLDVRYTVTLNAQEYVLDSCGTAVNAEQDPWVTLAKIWNYFETGEF